MWLRVCVKCDDAKLSEAVPFQSSFLLRGSPYISHLLLVCTHTCTQRQRQEVICSIWLSPLCGEIFFCYTRNQKCVRSARRFCRHGPVPSRSKPAPKGVEKVWGYVFIALRWYRATLFSIPSLPFFLLKVPLLYSHRMTRRNRCPPT